MRFRDDGNFAIDLRFLGPAVSDLVSALELYSAASAVYYECVSGNAPYGSRIAVHVGEVFCKGANVIPKAKRYIR